ncbi:MAG TPA: thiamine-phosphate kinase [Xanthomonadales bacterium]
MKEFELIRQIQQETSVAYTPGFEHGVKLGIGDDAAVLEVPAGWHLVAATDTLNAGVHFPVDTSPFDIGYKCLAVNLSDMAAMGAIPRWALLSLSLPEADPEWVHRFSEGFSSLAQPYGVTLVGGDTTSGPMSISLTALGIIEAGMQLTRGGAKPGDLVVVSGTTGGAAHVLDMLRAGKSDIDRQVLDRPQPRVSLGRALTGHASACIDISDGLLADLGHVLESSACGARLDIDKLPQNEMLAGLDEDQKRRHQLTGGDDYELLFTLPPAHAGWLGDLSRELGLQLSIIGEIEEGEGIRCLAKDGSVYHAPVAGFEHFRQKP